MRSKRPVSMRFASGEMNGPARSAGRIAVIPPPGPQVTEGGKAGAPGGAEDGVVADWCAREQAPQGLDDRRKGLVLGEPV